MLRNFSRGRSSVPVRDHIPSSIPSSEDINMAEMLAWLRNEGFGEGNLRQVQKIADGPPTWPMGRACEKGDLKVCQWLYDNGAAEDIMRSNDYFNPMLWASIRGHLSVCKWLYKMGASADIIRPNCGGITPMHWAAEYGHLSVCKFLFKVSTADIVTKEDDSGRTPMLNACASGHLLVCEWLFEVGAAKDIAKADQEGNTPMEIAYLMHRLPVCQWLLVNGGLNNPVTGHVDPVLVRRAFARKTLDHSDEKEKLLLWAREVLSVHWTFYQVFLHACVIVPACKRPDSPSTRCRLPLLPRTVLQQVACLLGVESQRRLRNVREFLGEIEAL